MARRTWLDPWNRETNDGGLHSLEHHSLRPAILRRGSSQRSRRITGMDEEMERKRNNGASKITSRMDVEDCKDCQRRPFVDNANEKRIPTFSSSHGTNFCSFRRKCMDANSDQPKASFVEKGTIHVTSAHCTDGRCFSSTRGKESCLNSSAGLDSCLQYSQFLSMRTSSSCMLLLRNEAFRSQ